MELDRIDKEQRFLRNQQELLDERVQTLEQEKEQWKDAMARTVAAPGMFTSRQYLLMRKINPKAKMGERPVKSVVGQLASKLCRTLGITIGKIVEGTFQVGTYPANILDEVIKCSRETIFHHGPTRSVIPARMPESNVHGWRTAPQRAFGSGASRIGQLTSLSLDSGIPCRNDVEIGFAAMLRNAGLEKGH